MTANKPRLLTTPILLFLATMILANTGRFMWQSLYPLYVQSLGADVTQVGLYFTLSSVAFLLFQILGGWLSDTIGRLEAIAIGSVAGVVGYVIIYLAQHWTALLVGDLFNAITVALIAPSFDAFIAEQSSEENRGRVYGLVLSIFTVVAIAGPLLGGLLVANFDFKALFLAAGILYTVAAAGRIWMALHYRKGSEIKREKPSFAGLRLSLKEIGALALAGGVVTWLFIGDGITDFSARLQFDLVPLYYENIHHIPPQQITWIASAAGVVTMLLTAGGGWLSDRRGERVALTLGMLAFIAGLAIFLLSSSLPTFIAAACVMAVGDSLVSPAKQSLISKVVPQRLRGTAFGLFSTSVGLLALPAPYLGAALWVNIEPRFPFLITLAAFVLVVPIIWFKLRIVQPLPDPEPTAS